jgi:hypothetical protein
MPNDSIVAQREARRQEAEMNGMLIYTPENAAQANDPPYKIYIWNLGPTRWEVPKGSLGTFIIPPSTDEGALGMPLVLPSVVRDSYFVEQEMKTHSVTGEFTAIDIVHPVTATYGAGKSWWSFGANLDDFGVFWTKNNPPTEAEVSAARGKMEITYRKLLQMAASIEAAGRIDDITPMMRIAAHYFGEDRAWNKIYRKTLECPGCGEPAKANIIRHPCGYVFDPDRALLAGMISEEVHKQMVKTRQPEPTKPTKGHTASRR